MLICRKGDLNPRRPKPLAPEASTFDRASLSLPDIQKESSGNKYMLALFFFGFNLKIKLY